MIGASARTENVSYNVCACFFPLETVVLYASKIPGISSPAGHGRQ